ncbi:MAG: NAD(P)(+) transhydrogenase (Re/Si-specific) subunit beta, partial [Saprospiraceae bacterium]|nr:NAD(P)(+) transhydrogenase (Re/Si-specific) subunit beta [Saprospiraceae bacterium]
MTALVYLMYLIGAIAFILGLRGLSSPKTARKGNLTAAFGMSLAIVASLIFPLEGSFGNFGWIGGALILGAAIGWYSAAKVEMTEMPQLVSIFNGLGGGSAMILALVEYLNIIGDGGLTNMEALIILFTLLVGGISFSGCILAYLKLDGKVKDKHVILPGHQYINIILLFASLAALWYAWSSPSSTSIIIATVVALVYGFSFVAPIGGAD